MADLDKAERFYRELLGLESPQGDPGMRLVK
jgi:catechol 2,3-dioxygenase-like lactoylglutathione lyase family enzyme